MPSLDLWVRLTIRRLPRDRCYLCNRRRVLYRLALISEVADPAASLDSVARCAKCLGIGK